MNQKSTVQTLTPIKAVFEAEIYELYSLDDITMYKTFTNYTDAHDWATENGYVIETVEGLDD